jgi:hypothetical protein
MAGMDKASYRLCKSLHDCCEKQKGNEPVPNDSLSIGHAFNNLNHHHNHHLHNHHLHNHLLQQETNEESLSGRIMEEDTSNSTQQ